MNDYDYGYTDAELEALRRFYTDGPITEPDLLRILNAEMRHLIERSKEAAEAAAEFADQVLDDMAPSRDADAELRHDLDEVGWQVDHLRALYQPWLTDFSKRAKSA
jgi:hypothetical protein